jgi:cell division protein FtsW (lipid II flippase)
MDHPPLFHSITLEFFVFWLGWSLLFAAIGYSENKKKNRHPRLDGASIFAAVIIGIFGAIIAVAADRGEEILQSINRQFGTKAVRFSIAVFLMLTGYMAYRWKQIDQRWYGRFEVGFGCAAVIFITLILNPDKSLVGQWVGLGSATYVIARGLNNVSEANEKTLKAKSQTA